MKNVFLTALVFLFSLVVATSGVLGQSATTLWVQTQSTLYFKAEVEEDSQVFLSFCPGNSENYVSIILGKNYHKIMNPHGKNQFYRIDVYGAAIVYIKNQRDFVVKYLLKDGKITYLP